MESAQHRACQDAPVGLSAARRFLPARNPLSDPLVRSPSVEVLHPFSEHPAKVLLAEDQDVIETLPAETAEKPLTDGVQVGRLRWDGEDIDARGGRGCREIASELVVVVPDQEARGVPIGRRLAKLLGDPRIGWGASDVDMHDLAAAVRKDDEGEDGTEPGVLELKEVAGPDIRRVVAEEGVPRLSKRLARAEGPHVLLDRPLAHAEAELEQFAADPFGSP